VTMEQICRVLNERMAAWLRCRCGVGERARTHANVLYHQTRNAAARKLRMRQRMKRVKELLAL
jgi:hypothetical protein